MHLHNQIELSHDTEDLSQSFCFVNRLLERQYRALPWPSHIRDILVFTKTLGGFGDIAAAAKAIQAVQNMSPFPLQFDWVLEPTRCNPTTLLPDWHYPPLTFFNNRDIQVFLRMPQTAPKSSQPADLLLTGPVKSTYLDAEDFSKKAQRTIPCNAPWCGFSEIGEDINLSKIESTFTEKSLNRKQVTYSDIHKRLFPFQTKTDLLGLIPMGLASGTGVFIDKERANAVLSQTYSCPSYLLDLQDQSLKKDILEAMNTEEGQLPDFNTYSLNAGYAHWQSSWQNFITCVALHEKNKHAVVVLNQKAAYENFSTERFQNEILNSETLSFLTSKGYGSITLKSEKETHALVIDKTSINRSLTVIIRPHFTPHDMRLLQLSSERLLATGDNSAVESLSARCKLYLYEDVNNLGCKWRFLQQQVDLAKEISPSLSRLLALFGGDRRLGEQRFVNTPFSPERVIEIEQLLADPQLEIATLQMCQEIIQNYSFEEVLEGAIKRRLWGHIIPDLMQVEIDCLDENFKKEMTEYANSDSPIDKKILSITQLPLLAEKINERVQNYLKEHPAPL